MATGNSSVGVHAKLTLRKPQSFHTARCKFLFDLIPTYKGEMFMSFTKFWSKRTSPALLPAELNRACRAPFRSYCLVIFLPNERFSITMRSCLISFPFFVGLTMTCKNINTETKVQKEHVYCAGKLKISFVLKPEMKL